MNGPGEGTILSGAANTNNGNIFVRIVEQPASKALRFRYECEGRSAGSLPGANSTHERKTFPKIQIMGCRGRGVVVVSCVTIESPHKPHPHNLVGKEGCKKGVCTLEINNEDMTCEFSNLGIQCVKKKDIEESLRVREEIRVDPFRTGFSHKSQPGSIDLNALRLCFQVFLEGPERGQFKVPLKPVVSEPIYDKKAINDLTIMKLSECSSPVLGNKEIILLCDKVSKDDIEIRFYEESSNGAIIWEAFGDFSPADVHKQYAISFRTPQYHQLEITSPRKVNLQLRCPSKDTYSEPRSFEYIPLSGNTSTSLSRKRKFLLSQSTLEDVLSSCTSNNKKQNLGSKNDPLQVISSTLNPSKCDYMYSQLNSMVNSENQIEETLDLNCFQSDQNGIEQFNGYEICGNSMVNDVNGNSTSVTAPIEKPPARPPKKSQVSTVTGAEPPALPPKKVVKSSGNKSTGGPIEFIKNLLSPSKANNNLAVSSNAPKSDNMMTSDDNCNYDITEDEMLEQLALYVDSEFPPKATFYEDAYFDVNIGQPNDN